MKVFFKKSYKKLKNNKLKFISLSLVLLLVIILETLFFVFKAPFNGVAINFQYKKVVAGKSGQDFSGLIIGDSSGQTSVSAGILSQILGEDFYNFSLAYSVSFIGQYFILRDYLRNNKPPKILVVMATCDSYGMGKINNKTLDMIGMVYLKESLLESLRDLTSFNYLFPVWIRILPSKRYEGSLFNRSNLVNLVSHNFNFFNFKEDLKRFQVDKIQDDIKNNGNIFWPDYLPEVLDFNLEGMLKNSVSDFSLEGVGGFYFKKILVLADDLGMEVFIVKPILYEPVYRRSNLTPFYNDCVAHLDLLPNAYSNVSIIGSGYHVFKDKESFVDNMPHLNYNYARPFSEKIAEEIKGKMAK